MLTSESSLCLGEACLDPAAKQCRYSHRLRFVLARNLNICWNSRDCLHPDVSVPLALCMCKHGLFLNTLSTHISQWLGLSHSVLSAYGRSHALHQWLTVQSGLCSNRMCCQCRHTFQLGSPRATWRQLKEPTQLQFPSLFNTSLKVNTFTLAK